jgi:hypothetical protein
MESVEAIKSPAPRVIASPETGLSSEFVEIFVRERVFLAMLGVAFLVAGATYETPHIAMWVGFLFASYSAVANDSIQTLGTFIASNRQRPWWQLWLWIGGIFLATVAYSFYKYSGDVSFQRLAAKGFETAPTKFHFLQIAAPIFLLILTRLRMPVSTTFLLLSSFATSPTGIVSITTKSLSGYVVAFVAAFALFATLSPLMKRAFAKGPAHRYWRTAQWFTTAMLWSVWIMQDAANIAIYLPRQLSIVEFGIYAGVIFLGLGILFRMGGERIQKVVDEKSDVVDVRAATVVDLIYAVVLFGFKEFSNVPMSTTWVFVGLLAGREIGMALRRASSDGRGLREAFGLMKKDLAYVTVGFAVALAVAMFSNQHIGT